MTACIRPPTGNELSRPTIAQSVFAPVIQVTMQAGASGDNTSQADKAKQGKQIAAEIRDQVWSLMNDWGRTNLRNNGIFNPGVQVR